MKYSPLSVRCKHLSNATTIATPIALRWTLVWLSCWAILGCGWQLRAGVRLPPHVMPVQIEAVDRYSDFYQAMQQSLIESGATLVSGSETAGATIRIGADASNATVLSVSSSRNTPEEYQVNYSIEYAIALNGHEVVPLQPLTMSSTYSYDTQAVLAKQREHKGVQKALARELARQVLQRLASVKPVVSSSEEDALLQ